jgi:AcrR family transcriptional regulator
MPKTLTKADVAQFRERICGAAETLFATRGPDGVTIRELADAVGVSAMTPYRYFKDRDAILAAVRARAFNRFADAMEAAHARLRKDGGFRPDKAYLDFALANRHAYRLMFDTNQPTASRYPELVNAMDRARATMTSGWRELADAGTFTGDVELAGRQIWAAMHGAIMLELSGLLRAPHNARTIGMAAIQSLSTAFTSRK